MAGGLGADMRPRASEGPAAGLQAGVQTPPARGATAPPASGRRVPTSASRHVGDRAGERMSEEAQSQRKERRATDPNERRPPEPQGPPKKFARPKAPGVQDQTGSTPPT